MRIVRPVLECTQAIRRWMIPLGLGLLLAQWARAAPDCDPKWHSLELQNPNPQVLKEVERRWIQAYEEPNAPLLACLWAEDFEIGSMPDKKLEIHNKQQVLDWVSRKTPSRNLLEQLVIGDHEDAAIARGVYSVRAPDGKLTSRFQFTDFFVYRAGRWRAVSRTIAELPLD